MNHEIKLSLIITGFEESPGEITQTVGIVPTQTWLKGELIDNRAIVKHKENGWRLSSGIKEGTFEDHLGSLFSILKPSLDKVITVCKKYHGELFCALYMSEGSEDSLPAIHFDKSTISLLSQLGIEVDLYIVP